MKEKPLEIIVSVKGSTPQKVPFENLFDLKDEITSIVLLWDTNSYFLNIENGTFIINGGRRLMIPDMEGAKLLYRKRNGVTYALTGMGKKAHKVNWIIGLEKSPERRVFLNISGDGKTFEWGTIL